MEVDLFKQKGGQSAAFSVSTATPYTSTHPRKLQRHPSRILPFVVHGPFLDDVVFVRKEKIHRMHIYIIAFHLQLR